MKFFSAVPATAWQPTIELIATDMDGTLTLDGKFDPRLLQRLVDLQNAGMPVVIVTGRSAGWVSGLLEYLPVSGAIAENGGYLFTPDKPEGIPLIDVEDIGEYRQKLKNTFDQLQQQFPQIQTSSDNAFRMTDWTFDNEDLTVGNLTTLNQLCKEWGWSFTYSSIQCHIKAQGQSKQVGLVQTLAQAFPSVSVDRVLTIGDSPNDSDLLDKQVFPYSVGVANIAPYLEQMPSTPQWVTQNPELLGFIEATDGLLT